MGDHSLISTVNLNQPLYIKHLSTVCKLKFQLLSVVFSEEFLQYSLLNYQGCSSMF